MKAMILAAGLGKRMRPLTDHMPKPLLKAKGKCLIEYHLEALQALGTQQVVINTHWLAGQVPSSLGDGQRWQMHIHYSHEPELLETAGGIRAALAHLDSEDDTPFLVVNGDIFIQQSIQSWAQTALALLEDCQACLALVPNPEHHPEGDFAWDTHSKLLSLSADRSSQSMLTYAGLALFRPSLFRQLDTGPAPLAPLLRKAINAQRITGLPLQGFWSDIGTPERLAALEEFLDQPE